IGLAYYHILVHMKTLIDDQWWAIAFTKPPLVGHMDCTTPLHCTANWKEEWWNEVSRQILHPDMPMTG
ncbi:hypothetical protein PAXRUDRAFT_173674, partial [Paxillus rubicundulus Ve08.2h10]